MQEGAIIDIEREDLDKILAEENVIKQSIHEANIKWHSEEEQEFRTLTGKYAVDFLKTMNGTLCYLMVAFRMLAKAPWTPRMVCVHVRQAALYAISKGWFFHTLTSHGIQFSRAEMALAAGTFLGDLTPNLPDDPDQPLFLTIHELPHICASLFSTGRAVCKCCGQTKSMPVPTFASGVSWSTPTWISLKHCLEQGCTPFPWILNPRDTSWHDQSCERQDVDIVDVQIGPWAYVSLRGESINDFPAYSTVTEILQDTSLSPQGLMIRAIVCCNLLETSARHFWLLEIENGKPTGLFDSLQGLMPVTVEATRKLRITGFLLTKTQTCCPVLKSKGLEQVAGKLARKERPSVSIAVRSRTAWLRATHLEPPKSTGKVKQSIGKQLGRFFGGSRRHTLTKPAAKTRTNCDKKNSEVCNRSVTKPAERETRPEVKAQPTLHSCVEGKEDKTGLRRETRAQPELGVERDLQHQVDYVLNADPGKALSGGVPNNTSRVAIKEEYGVISLFDGVSIVVPTLQKKLGYRPAVAILAEIDGSLRALVCAEFGYRPDQSWGRSKSGSACLYVKDVNSLLDDGCRRLQEAVAIAPGIKWIVVGGSPCQDLTFAGAFRGVLGLVGKNSRLFFTLLGVIRAMQDLVSKNNVRFLVENAGSMIDLHYQAFCTLLGIPPEPKSNYVWDPAEHGYGITRKRNFFRGHKDRQPIQNPQKLSPVQGGPLLLQSGQPITFPPLLRTRDLLPFEVCWSSWTLYQPCSLIWDYDFWGGPDAFRRKVVMHQGKVPQLQWEDNHSTPVPAALEKVYLSPTKQWRGI